MVSAENPKSDHHMITIRLDLLLLDKIGPFQNIISTVVIRDCFITFNFGLHLYNMIINHSNKNNNQFEIGLIMCLQCKKYRQQVNVLLWTVAVIIIISG